MPFRRLLLLLPVSCLLVACATRDVAPPVVITGLPAPAPPVAVAPPLTLAMAGELQQGSLVTGKVRPGSRVRIGERELRVADDGTIVFGLDRDAPAELVLDITLPDGSPWRETHPVRARDYRVQKVTGIAERIMNPTTADQKRIDEEAALVAAARARDDDRLDFLQAFIWPADGPITGVYGSQRYYNGVPKRPHYGVDVGVPAGTPVKAPAGGIVTLAHPDMFYSGGTLVIDHGHGVSSTMMHLSEVLVKTGDRVEQGQVVAKSGASGRSSGPHLDWRMNWFGERVDPELLVPPRR